MKKVIVYLELLRIRHWVKNGFVFMPLIFGNKLFNSSDLIRAISAFGIFCLLSSGAYIINDIKDISIDRIHPKKKHRPLAAGAVSTSRASVISSILLCMSLVSSYMMGAAFLFVAVLYIALHILYCFKLKETVIIDVISIALGFELRIWAGAIAVNILPSIWLQLCVFLLALFLGFIKRRHEKLTLFDKAAEHRGVLAHYTGYFLDQMIMISATLCIVSYGLYAVSGEVFKRLGNDSIAYTIPFVIYGIFRYLYLVHVKKSGGDPGEILTSDIPFMINILLWMCSVVFILYGNK